MYVCLILTLCSEIDDSLKTFLIKCTYVSVKVAVTATKFCVPGPMAIPFVPTSGNALGL